MREKANISVFQKFQQFGKAFADYKNVANIFIKNMFNTWKQGFSKFSKGKKTATGAIVGFALLVFSAYLVLVSSLLTDTLGPLGRMDEVFSLIIMIIQGIVLFFGALVLVGSLFSSKDNDLLLSLPVRTNAIFLARLTVAYVSELIVSVIVAIPMLTTVGIIALQSGYGGVGWHFFLTELISVLLVPIIPLVIASFLSLPLAYIWSKIKKFQTIKFILMCILCIIGASLYLLFLYSTTTASETDTTLINEMTIMKLHKVSLIGIFNYPLIEALSGNNVIGWMLIYIIGVLTILAVTLLLFSLLYKRTLQSFLELDSKNLVKAIKIKDIKRSSFKLEFMMKELRVLRHTPMIIASTLLTGIMFIGIIVIIGQGFTSAGVIEETGLPAGELIAISFISFLGIMLVSLNQSALIAISLEGKNILLLKTLPISASMIIQAKLTLLSILTAIEAMMITISALLALRIPSPSIFVGLLSTLFLWGYGINCFAIYADLKRPNLNWKNIRELMKFNLNSMKPIFLGIGFGIVCQLIGIVFSGGVLTSNKTDAGILAREPDYLLYFFITLIPSILLAIFARKKLFSRADELFEKVGD
ncbi:MAG: hypothetical protein LBU04_01455 [Christensenellaceae bacterium]|jgi:ABC-2 type transport system permease protein|nr:hypothetical protein [Christensenellaceae bacterium]